LLPLPEEGALLSIYVIDDKTDEVDVFTTIGFMKESQLMQSRAIVFTGKDEVEIIKEEVREPGPGEVLIKATKTLISTGTEGIVLSRLFEPGSHWDKWVQYPFHPGYSMVGNVVAVGRDVEGIHIGERFALREPHREYVTIALNERQEQGLLAVPTRELYPVPDGVADEDAPWIGLATIVQNGIRRAEHELGDSVVVIGLGLLGQLVVQYVRLLGARQVIAVDVSEQRLAMARAHGATITLAMGAQEAREHILALTDGVGTDVVYDVTGVAPVFSIALTLLRRFGRLVLLGDLTGDVINKALSIVGAHDSNPPATSTDHAYWSKQRMAELFFTYVLRGDMRVSDLITHRFSPLEAVEAYRVLREERMTAMGVIFDWTRL
jgi:2-desacetyl-2-hydroxyethyl bacteriochlorophyllide A dehydrogenase